MTHTKGDWYVDAMQGRNVVLSKIHGQIAVIVEQQDKAEERTNARLIAAAPKLLEALKWIVKRDGECLGDNPKQLQIFKERIAEAEGAA